MQRSIRFPVGLAAVIEARAKAEDRSFSYVVVRALEEALGGSSTAEHAGRDVVPNFEVAGSTPARPAPPRASEPRAEVYPGPSHDVVVNERPALQKLPAGVRPAREFVKRVDPDALARQQRLNKPKS